MSAVLEEKTDEQRPTSYDTHPDRYRHWRLTVDGTAQAPADLEGRSTGRSPYVAWARRARLCRNRSDR